MLGGGGGSNPPTLPSMRTGLTLTQGFFSDRLEFSAYAVSIFEGSKKSDQSGALPGNKTSVRLVRCRHSGESASARLARADHHGARCGSIIFPTCAVAWRWGLSKAQWVRVRTGRLASRFLPRNSEFIFLSLTDTASTR
jgi:hypothetical protein